MILQGCFAFFGGLEALEDGVQTTYYLDEEQMLYHGGRTNNLSLGNVMEWLGVSE